MNHVQYSVQCAVQCGEGWSTDQEHHQYEKGTTSTMEGVQYGLVTPFVSMGAAGAPYLGEFSKC